MTKTALIQTTFTAITTTDSTPPATTIEATVTTVTTTMSDQSESRIWHRQTERLNPCASSERFDLIQALRPSYSGGQLNQLNQLDWPDGWPNQATRSAGLGATERRNDGSFYGTVKPCFFLSFWNGCIHTVKDCQRGNSGERGVPTYLVYSTHCPDSEIHTDILDWHVSKSPWGILTSLGSGVGSCEARLFSTPAKHIVTHIRDKFRSCVRDNNFVSRDILDQIVYVSCLVQVFEAWEQRPP